MVVCAGYTVYYVHCLLCPFSEIFKYYAKSQLIHKDQSRMESQPMKTLNTSSRYVTIIFHYSTSTLICLALNFILIISSNYCFFFLYMY